MAGATDRWQDVIDDLEATAAEYAEQGWETVVIHPGDVTPLPTPTALLNGVDVDRVGLDLLVPDNEFEELTEAVEGVSFDQYDAYRGESGSVVFAVVVMKGDDDTAVCFPLYYDTESARVMLKRAVEREELRTYLRPLDDSQRVVFAHADPERLVPESFDPEDVDEQSLLDADGQQSRFPLDGEDMAAMRDEIDTDDSTEQAESSDTDDT